MKEKYIVKRKGKKGVSWMVSYKGNTKTFSEAKYGSRAEKMALKYRNELMVSDKIKMSRDVNVRDCFEEIPSFYNLRSETIRKYECVFNRYMKDYAHIPIDKLKKSDVIESLNKMVETASDNTIQRAFTIWKKIVFLANAKEYIEKDITFGLTQPTSHKISSPRAIIKINKELLIQVTSCLHDNIQLVYDREMIPLIIWVLYYTGLRPGEALALLKEDVRDGYIYINKELGSDRTESDVIRTTKTPQSIRRIPISDELWPYLDKAKEMSSSGILLANREGRHYKTSDLDARISNIGKKKGFKFNLYALRHNFSTQLLKNGVDPRTIQELMGHAHYTMSIDYARSSDAQMKEALRHLS